MDPREFPTKGNLMLAKNSLMLARQGYDLMDKKRNILLKELMGLIDEAKDIQEEIDATFTKAYACLQRANIEHGISKVREVKERTIKLAEVENSAYRLATNIKKTQKRANALKNITIPMYTNLVHTISNALEEKEREEFTRLKVIKRMKM